MESDNILPGDPDDSEILEAAIEATEAPGSVTDVKAFIPASAATAAAFVDKVVAGADPATAARDLGTSVATLFRDKSVAQKVTKLFDKYETDSKTRAKVVRARLMEIALEGSDKNAIAAAKLLGADPEVGIFSGSSGSKNGSTLAVQVNIGEETKKVLDSVEVIEEKK